MFIPTIGDYVTPRLVGGARRPDDANMIQTQFLRLNNAPLGRTLAVVSMVTVGIIAIGFVLLTRRWGRTGMDASGSM